MARIVEWIGTPIFLTPIRISIHITVSVIVSSIISASVVATSIVSTSVIATSIVGITGLIRMARIVEWIGTPIFLTPIRISIHITVSVIVSSIISASVVSTSIVSACGTRITIMWKC